MAETEKKRKRPPTFQHYPINRAKKLKKEWIEKAKIKSKWKAEKRREGLGQQPAGFETPQESSDKGEEEEVVEQPSLSTKPAAQEARVHPSRAPNLRPARTVESSDIPKMRRPKNHEQADNPQTRSLRDLAKEAYSKSSLHTFKADPLKKHRTAGRGSKAGETGRGQPNMKLRMNAMLEQIKRDHA